VRILRRVLSGGGNSRLAAPVGKSGLGHCVGFGRRVWSVFGGSLVVNPSQSCRWTLKFSVAPGSARANLGAARTTLSGLCT
jgi:hypothetical protein